MGSIPTTRSENTLNPETPQIKLPIMITGHLSHISGITVFALTVALSTLAYSQSPNNCQEIANDVRAAVEKDPSKVLMVVEDALVINESCAGDIVRSAIVASKADAALTNQIVQTATSVAPKQTVAINQAAGSAVPGYVAAAPVVMDDRPVAYADGKNPGKNPVNPGKTPVAPVEPTAPEEDFFIPSTIRGVFLIMPPASGPLPLPPTTTTSVSPAAAIP